MGQLSRVSKNNTKITKCGDWTVITLHSTDVVKFDKDEIVLNNGGYITATTVARMQQASRQYGLGFSVGRKQGVMSVRFNGEEIEFLKGLPDTTITPAWV
jgi:hypothetical protein